MLMMKMMIITLVGYFNLPGCKSSRTEETEKSSENAVLKEENIVILDFGKEDSIYLNNLLKDMATESSWTQGADLRKGLIVCRYMEKEKPCELHYVMSSKQRETSKNSSYAVRTRKMTVQLESQIHEFINKNKVTTKKQMELVVDVECWTSEFEFEKSDYESDPKCTMLFPRNKNELVFGEFEALEVAGKLQGNRSFLPGKGTDNNTIVTGKLECNLLKEGQNLSCVLKRFEAGALSEDFLVISEPTINKIRTSLQFALEYQLQIGASKIEKKVLPKYILLPIKCLVSFPNYSTSGKYDAICNSEISKDQLL